MRFLEGRKRGALEDSGAEIGTGTGEVDILGGRGVYCLLEDFVIDVLSRIGTRGLAELEVEIWGSTSRAVVGHLLVRFGIGVF